MSSLYNAGSRSLQERFDTTRLADRIEERHVTDEIDEDDRAFIEARDMFFLATADEEGRPQSSYKGGEPGFVRVLDEHTIAFPSYDGNGMYLSAGNVLVNPNVGLLFIDFEGRKRLRLNGIATIDPDDPLLAGVAGGAARRPRPRDGGLPELPALHPRVQARPALPVRAEERVRDARARLEADEWASDVLAAGDRASTRTSRSSEDG